jgi:hypothetical protein
MSDTLISIYDTPTLVCALSGEPLTNERDAVQLIGDAMSDEATLVVVPVPRLDPRFFELRSRVAGEIIQKFVNYGIRLAILGDISEHLTGSAALREFVDEANRGTQFWFVTDLADLERHLA